MLASPTTMAPAAVSLATMVASRGAISSAPGRVNPSQPAVVIWPATLVFALMTIGTPQSAPRVPRPAPPRRPGARPRRAPVRGAGLDRAVDAVVAVDAGQVPLDHLGHGVRPLRVEAVELRHRHVQQVAVNRGIPRRPGRGLAGHGHAKQYREQDERQGTAAKHPQRISPVAAPRVAPEMEPLPADGDGREIGARAHRHTFAEGDLEGLLAARRNRERRPRREFFTAAPGSPPATCDSPPEYHVLSTASHRRGLKV